MKWDMSKEEEDIDKQIEELEADVVITDKKETKESKGDIDNGDYWD